MADQDQGAAAGAVVPGTVAPAVVPGRTPGTTPPFMPSGSPGGVDEQTQKILNMLRAGVARRFAGQPRPAAVPGLVDPFRARQIGMGTASPRKWGFERFAAQLGANLQNAVAMRREAQIQKAEATYDYYGNLLNNLYSAQASDDQAQVQAAQKRLDNFYREPGTMRALEQAAKALNQSWLDPQKTTPHGVAMQRTLGKMKERDAARSRLSNLVHRIMGLGRRPQAQLTPEEAAQAGRQIQERAPSGVQRDEALSRSVQETIFLSAMKDDETRRVVEQAKRAHPNWTDADVFDRVIAPRAGLTPTSRAEGEIPLGPERVPRLNQALTSRYQVLNPGKPLPPEFTIPANATQKDYDRIDKVLESVEKAKGTKAQQDTVNELRRQTFEIARGKEDISKQAVEVAARSLASGDLTRLKDISSFRSDQRLLIYARAKQLNPNFSTAQVDRQIRMMELYTVGKQGDQLQSFGTFLEHAGALKDTMEALKPSLPAKLVNRSMNWLRRNVSDDPRYPMVLAALDPVQKEFESYLLNNRALYVEDRATVDKIVNADLPIGQLEAALEQMGHTVKARYTEAQKRFKNTMGGRTLEEMGLGLSDEAVESARKIGVDLGGAPRERPVYKDGKLIGYTIDGKTISRLP